MDTVDIKPGWDQDPFNATYRTVEGRERMYALGANDMKSGLAAILEALNGREVDYGYIKVAFLCDEEFWSFGADALVNSDFLDDVALAIATEPREDPIVPGEQWIGVGRCGRSELRIDVTGSACHGADALVDPDAVNAAVEVSKLTVALAEFCSNEKRMFQQGDAFVVNSAFVNCVQGGRGMLSVPDRGSVTVDRILLPNESPQEFRSRLEDFVHSARAKGVLNPRAKISIAEVDRPTPPCDPYYVPPEIPLVRAVSEVVRTVNGPFRFGVGRSVADENRTARRGICTLIIGPDGAGSHTAHEWVDTESVGRLVRVLRAICQAELPLS
jgi:acetylornithine deacetylase